METEYFRSILEVSASPHPVDLPPPVNSLPKLTTPPPVKSDWRKKKPGKSGITFGPGETPYGPVGRGGQPMD